MYFALLLLLAALLFVLPFLPAVLELRRGTDAVPLKVVREYDRDIRHFARGFRSYVVAKLPELATTPPGAGASTVGALPDGTPFVFLNSLRAPMLTYRERHEGTVRKLVLANTPLDIIGGLTFMLELYAGQDFQGGPANVYRGLLGEKDVYLGPGSVVLRWLHAEGSARVECDGTLYGRASAEQMISLGTGCRFERLYAPRIEFVSGQITDDVPDDTVLDIAHFDDYAIGDAEASYGDPDEREADRLHGPTPATTAATAVATAVAPAPTPPLTSRIAPAARLVPAAAALAAPPTRRAFELPHGAEESGGRWLVQGDLIVPEWSTFTGDLVATGRLRVGAGAEITGSVKGRAGVWVEDDARVRGSVVSPRDLVIGARCHIGGPVIAEHEVRIGAGARVGTVDRPTTVSAPCVRVQAGVVVHGTIWARDEGWVAG